jgi:prophage regulatory protein
VHAHHIGGAAARGAIPADHSTQAMATQATKPKRGTINPQPLHVAQIADALLTIRTAGAVSGLSSATIYRKAASDPTFPKLIRIGTRCTRIRAGDLTAWLATQARA